MRAEGISVELINPYCHWSTARLRAEEGTQSVQVWARGHAWAGGRYLEGQTLAAWLANALRLEPESPRALFHQALLELKGFYALVVRTQEGLLAAVDHLRSIPLFYGSKGQHLLLSDDAYAVRAFVGDQSFDDLSVKEFLLTGYVTGAETIFPNVRQLQAGEYLWIAASQPIQARTACYCRFAEGDSFSGAVEDLCEPTQELYEGLFGRLVRGVGRRQIVIPLSGGIDSRSVAAMCKLMGATDVLCFTYGEPGNWEASVSRTVSERLGYDWAFVPYSRRSWREWSRSSHGRTYVLYGSQLVSIPYLQDWPAVWELKKAGRIADDAVIVPGITVTREILDHPQKVGAEEAMAVVLRKYYALWMWRDRYEELAPLLKRKLLPFVAQYPVHGLGGTINAFESWGVQEANAKFFANSVRTYEFWGHDWRLPLFSREMTDFWARVPLDLRIDKRLCRAYLERKVFSPLGIAGLDRPRPTRNENRSEIMLRRLANPYLAGYDLQDIVRSWWLHSQAFGGRWRSLGSLLAVNSVCSAATLRRWEETL